MDLVALAVPLIPTLRPIILSKLVLLVLLVMQHVLHHLERHYHAQQDHHLTVKTRVKNALLDSIRLMVTQLHVYHADQIFSVANLQVVMP